MKNGTVLSTTFEVYEVRGTIGAGGSGDVMLAQASDGSQVAVKALRANQPRNKLARFRNELQFCSTNKHPNIVSVIDRGVYQGRAGDQPFYVMPLYASTLRREMSSKHSDEEKLRLVSKILDGVEAAHLKGIFHRDLKPENILMNPDRGELVIADFGIAHFEEEELAQTVVTQSSDRLANFEYAAPEQRRPGAAVNHSADIYALGLIVVEIFTGMVPHGVNPATIASVSPEYGYLDALTNSMREQEPQNRPRSIALIKNELIARRADFVQRQQLNKLENTVIPASSVADPLIDKPITLANVKFDGGELLFFFSAPPNANWIYHFQNMGSFTSIMGKEPRTFRFQGNVATISVRENEAQQVVNYMKTYVETTNNDYARSVRLGVAQDEERARRELREEAERTRERIETNERVNAGLRW